MRMDKELHGEHTGHNYIPVDRCLVCEQKKELDGIVLAQNNKTFNGYTVFLLPIQGNHIEFMTLADVKQILKNLRGRDKGY